mmetsp:Transcript_4721/g.10702  ORF Transcript_4721/g.10702 Transcript_4721/m.10702 type:complete len:228 (+) Transcript_4721:1933-2616(+)
MHDRLGVQLARSQVPGHARKAVAIREGILVVSPREATDSRCLNFIILGPNDLTGTVHGYNCIVRSEFYYHATFIETNGKFGSLLRSGKGPCALHSVIERCFCTVCSALPQSYSTILGRRTNEGKLGMEENRTDIVSVSIQRVHDRFRLIIPNFHGAIIGSRENVRLVPRGVIINTVHSALVSLQGVMGEGTPQPPNLDTAIQRSGCKRIRILGVELDHHDIVGMPLE